MTARQVEATRQTTEEQDLHDVLNTSARPLNAIPDAELCPGSKALAAINASLR